MITLTKEAKGYIIFTIVFAILCSAITFHLTAKHYQAKYDILNSEFTAFKAQYSTVVKEKEDAVVAKALADKAAKVPLKEYVKGDTVTKIEYVEKESKSDASLEITNKLNPITVSYNGMREELATTTKEGKKIVDGKFVVTQESSSTIGIDSIVNRQIANKVLDYEHDKKVLERQKTQQTFWGAVVGVGIGRLIK